MSATVEKKRRTRSSPKARPAYVILEVLGEDNEPMKFDKSRLRVVGVERNAEAVVAAALNEDNANRIVLKVTVPASPNSRPALATAA